MGIETFAIDQLSAVMKNLSSLTYSQINLIISLSLYTYIYVFEAA